MTNSDGNVAYLKAGAEQALLAKNRELFSFGSGLWTYGSDATQAMNDSGGQWIKCHLGLSSMVILEKKKIPQHLAELPCLDQPVELKELLMSLEDQGEVTWA